MKRRRPHKIQLNPVENDPDVITNTPANTKLHDKQFISRINTSSGMYVVCENAFLGIHGIKQGRIRRLTTIKPEQVTKRSAWKTKTS